jgi:hypothetical protein
MSADDSERIIVDLQMVLIRLWILADKVAMREMQNDAMKQLLIMFRTCEVRPEAARFAWDATTNEKMLDAIVFSYLYHQQVNNKHRPSIHKYDDDDHNQFAALPGFMHACFVLIRSSDCNMLDCKCRTCCYYIPDDEFHSFLVRG